MERERQMEKGYVHVGEVKGDGGKEGERGRERERNGSSSNMYRPYINHNTSFSGSECVPVTMTSL